MPFNQGKRARKNYQKRQSKSHHGYRRICGEIVNRGKKMNHKKVQRIILNRNFTAEFPNEKWIYTIGSRPTYSLVETHEGKIKMSPAQYRTHFYQAT